MSRYGERMARVRRRQNVRRGTAGPAAEECFPQEPPGATSMESARPTTVHRWIVQYHGTRTDAPRLPPLVLRRRSIALHDCFFSHQTRAVFPASPQATERRRAPVLHGLFNARPGANPVCLRPAPVASSDSLLLCSLASHGWASRALGSAVFASLQSAFGPPAQRWA